jgi:hypothetical protein
MNVVLTRSIVRDDKSPKYHSQRFGSTQAKTPEEVLCDTILPLKRNKRLASAALLQRSVDRPGALG